MSPDEAKTNSDQPSGRFAYEGLERAIHEKARLGLMTSLLAHPDGVSFNDLKSLCDLTDGNLNRHLDVLHADGLISIEKDQSVRRSKTICRLTPLGRQRFLEYLVELQRVITDAAAAAASQPAIRFKWATGG